MDFPRVDRVEFRRFGQSPRSVGRACSVVAILVDSVYRLPPHDTPGQRLTLFISCSCCRRGIALGVAKDGPAIPSLGLVALGQNRFKAYAAHSTTGSRVLVVNVRCVLRVRDSDIFPTPATVAWCCDWNRIALRSPNSDSGIFSKGLSRVAYGAAMEPHFSSRPTVPATCRPMTHDDLDAPPRNFSESSSKNLPRILLRNRHERVPHPPPFDASQIAASERTTADVSDDTSHCSPTTMNSPADESCLITKPWLMSNTTRSAEHDADPDAKRRDDDDTSPAPISKLRAAERNRGRNCKQPFVASELP